MFVISSTYVDDKFELGEKVELLSGDLTLSRICSNSQRGASTDWGAAGRVLWVPPDITFLGH